MTEEYLITKTKKYLVKLKNGKKIKLEEINELKTIIEQLDSISYKLKYWRNLENEFRKK